MTDTTEGLVEPFKTHVDAFLVRTAGWVNLLSAYRSPAEQEALRAINGCAGREYERSCVGNPPTALPGTSNHNRGLAIDIHPNDRDYTAMQAVAAEYAIYFPLWDGTRLWRSEPWHGEPTGGVPTAPLPDPQEEDEEMGPAPSSCMATDGRRWSCVRGVDGALWVKVDNGEFFSLGGILTSGPSVSPDRDGKVHIEARGDDGATWAITGDGYSWSPWWRIGGQS